VSSRQVLICRNYKGDVDMSEIDHFFNLLMQQEEEGLPGETGERGQEQPSLLPWEPASCPARLVTVFALQERGQSV